MTGLNYTSKGYCSETDIENLLLIDIDNSFSAQVEDWIAAAEKYVDNYLGYTTVSGILAESIVNEVVDGRVDSELDLMIFPRKIPVISVSSVSLVKGTTSVSLSLTDGNGNTRYNITSANNYILFPNEELETNGPSLINNFAELRTVRFFVKMNYIAGFTQVPADIRLATANLVAETIMRHTNKEGLNMLIQGRVTKKWDERRFKETDYSVYKRDAIDLLKPYRIASRWL